MVHGSWIICFILSAYLEQSDHKVNLIEVDWSKGAYNPIYCPSADRVPDVGHTVAKFIGLNMRKFNLQQDLVRNGSSVHFLN